MEFSGKTPTVTLLIVEYGDDDDGVGNLGSGNSLGVNDDYNLRRLLRSTSDMVI